MFYKIIPVLVDYNFYIAKKWHFCPKISKIRQYTEVILPDTNAVNSNNLKNKQLFPNFVPWNFDSLLGTFPAHCKWCFVYCISISKFIHWVLICGIIYLDRPAFIPYIWIKRCQQTCSQRFIFATLLSSRMSRKWNAREQKKVYIIPNRCFPLLRY